jgi:hypothetical protein
LNNNYETIKAAQVTWPQLPSDPKQLYRSFYSLMNKVSHNVVCACCVIIGHDIDKFNITSTNDGKLAPLAVDPEMVPFPFDCKIIAIDQHRIMIDLMAIINLNTISVCNKCYNTLSGGYLPVEALKNFCWIGPLPEELKDLTWVKEALVVRSHLFRGVFQFEERKHGEPAYSSIKGHIVLVPQNTIRHALNLQKLKETTATTDTLITHCKAEVISNHGLSVHQLYSIIQGSKKAFGDGILSVIPRALLMITKNLNQLLIPLVNEAIVEFYRFSGSTNVDGTSKSLTFLSICSLNYNLTMKKSFTFLGFLLMWSPSGQNLSDIV